MTQFFVGSIVYFATGEGHHEWVYVSYATDEEDFCREMQQKLDIDEYFMGGLEFDYPPVLEAFAKEIDIVRRSHGVFSRYFSFNFS